MHRVDFKTGTLSIFIRILRIYFNMFIKGILIESWDFVKKYTRWPSVPLDRSLRNVNNFYFGFFSGIDPSSNTARFCWNCRIFRGLRRSKLLIPTLDFNIKIWIFHGIVSELCWTQSYMKKHWLVVRIHMRGGGCNVDSPRPTLPHYPNIQ